MKTLKDILDYCQSCKSTSTLRRVLPQMIEAFNNSSEVEKLHYAYHEDGANTWVNKWAASDYYPDNFEEDTQDIFILFEQSWLIGKKKQALKFQRANTYTAECAIFLFKVAPADINYRVSKLKSGWEQDFLRAKEIVKKEEETAKIHAAYSDETKQHIANLQTELENIFGTYNSSDRRIEINSELAKFALPPRGKRYSCHNWIECAVNCNSVETYIERRKNEIQKKLSESLKS